MYYNSLSWISQRVLNNDEIKNKRYNCKIHGLYTGAMYIQTNVSSS